MSTNEEVKAAAERMRTQWTLSSKIVCEDGSYKQAWIDDMALIVDTYLSDQHQLAEFTAKEGPLNSEVMTLDALLAVLESWKAIAGGKTCVSFESLCYGASSLWHQTHRENFRKVDRHPGALSRWVLEHAGSVTDDFPTQVLGILRKLESELSAAASREATLTNRADALETECFGWRKLVNDCETVVGFKSWATNPESTCLVDACQELVDAKSSGNESVNTELLEACKEYLCCCPANDEIDGERNAEIDLRSAIMMAGAKAYEAALPVDSEWLLSIGFTDTFIDAADSSRLAMIIFSDRDAWPDGEVLLVYNDDGSYGFWERPIDEHGDWHAFHNHFSRLKTRGNVLDLLQTLGIKQKEKS